MNIDSAVNLDDIRTLAKRRLPKIAFDFIDGGVDDEEGMALNRAAFRRYRLLPRYLVDVSKRDQSVEIFGRRFAIPIGISPTGTAGLFRRGADLMLARAAAKHNIPYLMSSAANDSIEDAAKAAPDNAWFQIYGNNDWSITRDMIKRARDAGVSTIVQTVDVPISPRRERNIRNGFTRPLKMNARIILDGITHPGWLYEFYSNGGLPMMKNWQPYAKPGATRDDVADLYGVQTPSPIQTWKVLEDIRREWPGNLVVKGLLHPDDAIRATEIGANGIIVSNHGGRQLDRAPSPLEVLPAIRDAVGHRTTLIFESGVRRGSDIVIAMCLGARMCLFGRPTLFGAAAAGPAGIDKVLGIVRTEVDTIMTQIGCPKLEGIGPEFLLGGGKV